MPSLCTVSGTLLDVSGVPINTTVTFRLVGSNTTTDNNVVSTEEFDVVVEDGSLSTVLIRTDQFDLPNVYYEVTCEALGWSKKRLTLAAATFNLADL